MSAAMMMEEYDSGVGSIGSPMEPASPIEAYRVSLSSLRTALSQLCEDQEADDPDLDALLADLCQLEEDTKAQLATSQSLTPAKEEEKRMRSPDLSSEGTDSVRELPPPSHSPPRSSGYCHLAIRTPPSAAVSSDDFAQIMQSLQDSRNVVQDPSRTLSIATYATDTSSGMNFTDSKHPHNHSDLFSAQSALMRSDSQSSIGHKTTPKRSSVRRTNSNMSDGSAETLTSPAHDAVQKQLDAFADQLSVDEALTPEQQIQKLKNEKLRLAMVKLKEASVQKMVLKVHNVDGSTKMIAIHEGMNTRDVCILLAERNHKQVGPNWTLVEKLVDLHLERALEDHERVLECLAHWPRGHNNSVVFKNNPEKYYLLKRPQILMPSSHVYSSVNPTRTAFTEEQKKNIILKELFKNKILPKLEGDLHIRDGKKNSWKKHLFVLRASGLYYSKNGKSLASKDIVRVVEWKDVECYTGTNYKKFYRSPGPHCFSLVPHGPLTKNEKRIIHICVPSKHDLMAWMTGIRLAKHGLQLKQNYEDTKAEMPWLQLEDDNLDLVTAAKAEKPQQPDLSLTSARTPSVVVVQQNGREPPEQAKKRLISPRGSFQPIRPDSSRISSRESTLSPSVSDSHVISGPVTNDSLPGTMRRNRSQQSVLASAFEGAWKQGNLAAEMNRDSQMWPVFSTPVKTATGRRSPHESLRKDESLPYEEEMSGMFTLKKKKDKEKAMVVGEEISRSASISSRPSSSDSGGHRRRSQSMEPSQSRTSRSSSQNQL